MKQRKPRIKKEDASMIAIRFATEQGHDVGLKTEVSDPMHDGNWVVFVPDRIPGGDPGGVIVKVHKQTGQPKITPSL